MLFDEYAQSFRDGRLDNPLRDCPEPEIDLIVTAIYTSSGFEADVLTREELKRGALLAQNPPNLSESVPSDQSSGGAESADAAGSRGPTSTSGPARKRLVLTPHEMAALRREKKGQLSCLTKDLIVVLVVCALGAITQGWSQESIVGANLNWPIDLGIASRDNGTLKYHDPSTGLIYFGLVNAIPYFAACLVGVWIIDPISAFRGRRGALFFAAICSFAAPIGASSCTTWIQLFGCRLVQGIGMGAKASVVPVLESEVCPPSLRGRLLVLWQTFVAVGIFLGAAMNRYFLGNWRQQIAYAFLPAIPLLCLCYIITESPRWLIKKREYVKAFSVLTKLRETKLQAARELVQIYAQAKLERRLYTNDIPDRTIAQLLVEENEQADQPVRRLDFFRRFLQLFTIKRNLRAVMGSCAVMIAQQFSGINIFALLATTIFGSTSADESTNLWMNFGFAASNTVFSGMAFLLVERVGRRTLLLTSLTLMLPLLLITGHVLDEHLNANQIKPVAALVVLFALAYSPGAGVIPFMYSSEVFGQTHREIGMSLAVAVNLGLAGVIAMAVPQYESSLEDKHMHLLGAFAGFDGLAILMVYFFMRTPGTIATLEDMNFLFGAPTSRYFAYLKYVARLTFRFWRPEPKKPFGSDWQDEGQDLDILSRNDGLGDQP